MKITKISYGALAPTYGYSNEKLTIDAEIQEGESLDEAIARLKAEVHERLNDRDRFEKWEGEYRDLCQRIRHVREQAREAHDEFQSLKKFCVAQGIKPSQDWLEFPESKLLAPAEFVEGELDPDF